MAVSELLPLAAIQKLYRNRNYGNKSRKAIPCNCYQGDGFFIRETISYWPEFVLPYQREPLETHEQATIEHLQRVSLRVSAAKIGYDPRTLSRWIKLILAQALVLIDAVIRRILIALGQEILPLSAKTAREVALLLLACFLNYAGQISFTRLHRLMGLCNLLGKGDWDLWGRSFGEREITGKRETLTRLNLSLRVSIPTNPGCRQTS